MKKLLSVLLVAALLSIIFTFPAFAAGNQPVGGCPTGFSLTSYMDSTEGPMNMSHIGVKVDLNGNGFVCMKMVTPDFCLHVDDSIPLP